MQSVSAPRRLPQLLFSRKGAISAACVLVLFVLGNGPAVAQISGSQMISDTAGGLSAALGDGDRFGGAAARLGDLSGDGNAEVAVGAPYDDDGDTDRGAVYVLFLGDDGTVQSEQKISDTAGGFGGALPNGSHFGRSVTRIGDVDGDGTVDLAVGAAGDGEGAVWILFLESDGTVADQQKISETAGGFGETLPSGARFGESVTGIGFLGGDDVPDLAVGAPCGDGTSCQGAVWTLRLNGDGTVAGSQKITESAGGFGGSLSNGDNFGKSLTRLGDFDRNRTTDIVAGAWQDDDGGTDRGALWVLFLESDGTVTSQQKISDTAGGFAGALTDNDNFGTSADRLSDLNGDKVPDLVVASQNDEDGGPSRGAAWVLYMNFDGTVTDQQKISDTEGGFDGPLDDYDYFGTSVSSVGDLTGDGIPDFAVGAEGDDDGGTDRGALWVLVGDRALLPVELASFEAVNLGHGDVSIRWTAASENSNAGFVVQHRDPSKTDWTKLGFVESKATGGTTTEAKTYRYRTEGLEVGTHQFRLKQVDLDGSAHLHEPVAVEVQMQKTLRLDAPVPNPAQSQAIVSFGVKESKETRVTLYNMLGQKVRVLYEGAPAAGELQSTRIDVSNLASGTYLLRLRTAAGAVEAKKLTVLQ